MVGFDARTQQGAALRPTSHFVYESIYTAILEKRLAPAAKLSKETLGQIFRVSNGTIQRALTRLAEDGAVVMPPKEVASVARPDERQARQVLDARLLVESEVVRQLPAGLDPAALAELRALVDEEQACLAARDSAGLIRLAGRFHLRLAFSFGDSAGASEALLRPLAAGSLELDEPLVGRSRMWPMLDFTTYWLPRYLLMVLALAGDSTMTSDLPMDRKVPASKR